MLGLPNPIGSFDYFGFSLNCADSVFGITRSRIGSVE